MNDINESTQPHLLSQQNTIDSSSLGGSLKESAEKHEALKDKSPSLNQCIETIYLVNPDNTKSSLALFMISL